MIKKTILAGTSALLMLCWAHHYLWKDALPFFSYFSDPELAYIFSALTLSEWGFVELTDHPGTLTQLFGALIAYACGLSTHDAFNVDRIDLFRNAWLACSALLLSFVIVLLHNLNRSALGLLICLLLVFHDYNSLVYWGRFTPEGSFTVLYLPIALLFIHSLRMSKVARVPILLYWGLLLGVATTIKLTLWPVSLFLCSLPFFYFRDSYRKLFTYSGVLFLSTSISYLITSTFFAHNRKEQLDWLIRLVTESGRYGTSSEHGAFLPLPEIYNYFITGLQLQEFTTLVPIILLTGWAGRDIVKNKSFAKDQVLGICFITSLAITFIAYAKHPYQIKYLLPQTLLFVLYFVIRFGNQSHPGTSLRFQQILCTLLLGVTFTAFANYNLLHLYTKQHLPPVQQQVDLAIRQIKPNKIYLSIDVTHPLKAFAFAAREHPSLLAIKNESRATPTSIFRERTEAYRLEQGKKLPLEQIERHALVFTSSYFIDPRVKLLAAPDGVDLYVYYAYP